MLGAAKEGKGSTVVSVKSSKQKRKAGQTAEDVYNEVFGEKEHKKHKKHKKRKAASKVWATFVKRAFVGAIDDEDLEEKFGH